MRYVRTWLIYLLLALTGCATTIETAPRLEMHQPKALRMVQQADRQAVAVQQSMQTMFDIEPVEDNVLATILKTFQSAEWLPYENGRAPPVNIAQVATNPIVTGVCPPETQGVTGVTGTVGNCETPSFVLALQTTLVPNIAYGLNTATFTRATTAYQTDFEGKLNLVPSGAARLQGARYVRNLVPKSEDLSVATGGWSVTTATVTSGVTDPLGGTTAYTITANGADSNWFRNISATIGAADTVRQSIWIRRRTGTGNVHLYTGTTANDATASITSALTTSWQRLSTLRANAGTNNYIGVLLATSGDEIDVWRPQSENVTGQTNQNPSEYVSVGVLSAPYHGAGVDGVKYFSTLNGNTVASNVVTEATGAAITSSTAEAAGGVTAGVVDASGPLGYLVEGARTNVILQSNTLGTTWTVSNAADMEAVAADAYVSTDGTTTMDKLQPKATTAVHSLDQAFTFTAAKYTFAMDLRYVPATPQRWVALILNDGTTTWGASFDLLNGVVGAVSAGATSTIAATAIANVYRVSVTNTANAAAAAGTVKISLNATDTATLESAARAGTETLGVGMVQLEIGTFASTPITTTTTTIARNADVLTYASAGNISGAQGTAYMELSYLGSDGANPRVLTDAANGPILILQSNAHIEMYDGTNLIDSGIAVSLATLTKVAGAWSSATGKMRNVVSGSAGTEGNFDGNLGMTSIIPGATGFFGIIRKIRIYPVKIPVTRLQIITTNALNWLRPNNWAIAANDDRYRLAANQ